MKKILAVLLLFTVCLISVSCGRSNKPADIRQDETLSGQNENVSNDDNNKKSKITPILYRVSDDDGDVIWLFGSVHVGTEDFYPLPDYVMNAFEESEALAVEFDLVAFEKDLAAQTKALSKLIYTDGTTIKDHIPLELYNDAVSILEKGGSYNVLLDYYIPSLWESMVMQAIMTELNVDFELGVDKHLINKAYEDEKEILDIESAELQYGMMADFSNELQIYLLEEAVDGADELDELEEELNALVECWSKGDAKGLNDYLTEEETDDPEEQRLYEEYNKAMTVDRNKSMTEYAVDALENGNELFICVGAAHIVGDIGMAQQLKDMGYTVEIVK